MAVSCKDYQPDIDALDSRLTKVESALQDLQNQINSLKNSQYSSSTQR